MLGGLIIASTASNGLVNFPIGSLLASCLSLSLLPRSSQTESSPFSPTKSAHCSLLLVAAIVLCVCSFRSIYGEIGPDPLRRAQVRIPSGIFAGLLTTADQAVFISDVSRMLSEPSASGKKIVVIGRLPGIYLLTPMLPTALTTWNYDQPPESRSGKLVASFYRVPANQPDFIARYTDFSPVGENFLKQYHLLTQRTVGFRSLFLYGR
jgi:hypothetical protein